MKEIWRERKGQISMTVAIIGALGAVLASMFTSWGVAGSQIGSVQEKVKIVEEREQNHYGEVEKRLGRMEDKIDRLILKK